MKINNEFLEALDTEIFRYLYFKDIKLVNASLREFRKQLYEKYGSEEKRYGL